MYITYNFGSKFNNMKILFTVQMVELSIRLVVMWSVPFNLNLHDSCYSMWLVDSTSRHTWFSAMYRGQGRAGGGGLRMERLASGTPLLVTTNHFLVTGHMQPLTYQPLLNISIVPRLTTSRSKEKVNKK